jgi:Flp pilus assembly protein TadD
VALGRSGDARRYLQRAVAHEPDAVLMTMLGRVARIEGNIDDAEACFRQALRLNPRDVEAADNLSLTLRQRGRRDEATRYQQRADALRRQSAPTARSRGALPRHAL